MRPAIAIAADVLLRGGVIAYPTEGVYGLGCLPDDDEALSRLLGIKQRRPDKGLILIASQRQQLDDWVEAADIPRADPQNPVTWIAAARPGVSPLVRGRRDTIAVRLTGNRTAASLCDAVGMPVVSTSANLSGQPVARNRYVLRRQLGACVDYIVPGDCGPAAGPSEIRDLRSGKVLRPATT